MNTAQDIIAQLNDANTFDSVAETIASAVNDVTADYSTHEDAAASFQAEQQNGTWIETVPAYEQEPWVETYPAPENTEPQIESFPTIQDEAPTITVFPDAKPEIPSIETIPAETPKELGDNILWNSGNKGGSKAELEANPFDEKGNLKSNIKYTTGEYDYLYETDDMGRISKFETDNLQLTDRDERLPHNPNTPGKLDGDHAGHLAGDRFGGSPDLDNIVSQSSNVNLSQYKKIENQWAKAINEGKNVKVNVEVKYDGESLRPSKFNVDYEIDGEVYSKSLLN